MIVHLFEETIGGRAYHIEVTPISNRWRAQLRRADTQYGSDHYPLVALVDPR